MEEEAVDLGFGGGKCPQKMGPQMDGMVLRKNQDRDRARDQVSSWLL